MENVEAAIRIQSRDKFSRWFPEEGPLARSRYVRHMEFFGAGQEHTERCFMAANRIGKTESGAYEMVCHLTGRYPVWWDGFRFNRPIKAWAAGETSQKVKEVIQSKLFGPWNALGTGMIPADAISGKPSMKVGIPEAIGSCWIKHVSGGESRIVLKSYEQGWEAFDSDEIDFIWLDEEPGAKLYTASRMRLMTTGGRMILTFTPLEGHTEVVEGFYDETERAAAGRYYVNATWDDAPHLDSAEKQQLWASILPFQRDARSKGIPTRGAGAIYPIPEEDIKESPFQIPLHWKRGYALDVGWNRTAALWGASDPDVTPVCIHLYAEHYRAKAEPSEHARAIRGMGKWIPGVIDPAARGRSQKDGEQLIKVYRDLGLNLAPANNAVHAGLQLVWELMISDRLKVFASLQNWWKEFNKYSRDEDGNIVKVNDHLMDDTRYLCQPSGVARMIAKPKTLERPTVEVTAWS